MVLQDEETGELRYFIEALLRLSDCHLELQEGLIRENPRALHLVVTDMRLLDDVGSRG